MKIHLYSLYLTWLTIFYAIPATALGINYINNLGFEEHISKGFYKNLKADSKILKLLECPIEMIERQWGGSQSVIAGIGFLELIIDEIESQSQELPNFIQNCQDQLAVFRRENKFGHIRSRTIVLNEYDALVNLYSKNKRPELMKEILSSLNQATLCYSNGCSFKLDTRVFIEGGLDSMECFSPLGRRFSLKGISSSYGLGATASLPNVKKQKIDADFQIHLFEHEEKSPWRLYRGGNELVLKALSQKGRTPLFYRLGRAIDIKSLAEASLHNPESAHCNAI